MGYEGAYVYKREDLTKNYVLIRNTADPTEEYRIRRAVYERGRIISTCEEWSGYIVGYNGGNVPPPDNLPWWIIVAINNLRKLYNSSNPLGIIREVSKVIQSYELCVNGVSRKITREEMMQIVGAMHYINQNKLILISHQVNTKRIELCINLIERTII